VSRVAWIGTGVMGGAMCGHLLDAGHQVRVFSRTRARAEPLLERGATWAGSPAEAAAGAEAVLTIVGTPGDVREVVLGEHGALAAMAPASVLVDLTTSEPALAIEIAEAAAERGVLAVDAPVSGGDVGARDGKLVVMAGGSDEAFAAALPYLEAFARHVARHGPAGSGQHTKMVNQIAIASGMVGLCEAILYAVKAGLDPERVLATISLGAAGSWSLENLGPRILRGELGPGFMVDHFVKDLGIALAEARRLQLALPGTALAEQLYVAAQAAGDGAQGTHALIETLARLSATPSPGG
jgi:3-hydroxyisobutyrate dehydrogenase